MPKFVKKPIIIEAVRWDGRSIDPMMEFLTSADIGFTPQTGKIMITTLEGTLTAQPGDWIIKGVKGEFYPCKDDIFQASYDAVPPPE